ncbi:geranylgeranyl reductase family protein [Ideonella sp.]|uniref:geranylgeranyl reductase family protein n=1 Tax=Ideonella sp. TaxID=1929293 RepID=UPI0035ADDA3A
MTLSVWNQPLAQLPERCDVLVVGAGPAGSACARVLALAGRQVVLVDAQAFPRDKVCGDGLVPDAHAALRELGVHDAVMARAHAVSAACCVAPGGTSVDVPGELAVLPRRELDALLCQAAVDAGARMVAPARFVAPLTGPDGRVTGARLRQGTDERLLAATWTVLATGAPPAALLAAGLCERRTPSAMALRAYVHHPDMAAEVPNLRFVWHRRLRGGYGWVFPAGEGRYNIGVGVLDSHTVATDGQEPVASGKRSGPNLRTLFDDFLAADPVAARLMHEGQLLGELKGAPLRCDLDGARWHAPGVLVAGEAAGSTYAFTGEGIGKALETGIAAARALLGGWGSGDAAVRADYDVRMQALLPRFRMYRQAASFNRHPLLVGLMVWRARRSQRTVQRLSDILNERRMPGSLLSWRGFRAMMLG